MKSMRVSRRVLAAGALSAIVALSYVDSALAAAARTSQLSTCSGVSAELNSDPDGGNSNYCTCETGYSDNQNADATTPFSTAVLDCKYCAPGYYLSTPETSGSDTGVGAVCSDINPTKLAAAAITAADTGADIKTSDAVQAPATPGTDDACAADHFGAATSFDGTGCTACTSGTSTDGKTGQSYCSVVAIDYYGTAGSATAHASSVTGCPANSHSAAGSTVIGDCKCDSGFKATANSQCTLCTSDTNWITAPSVSASTATVCSAADSNYYVSTAATTTNDAAVTACPSNSVTNAGATALSECVVPGGRYLQTASTTSGSVATQTAPAGWYATGGASVTDTTMAVGVANTALVATTDYSAKNLFKCPKKTINGVEFSSTTDVSNNGEAGSVEECFFDVDYATARQLIATETTGLYVMETSLTSNSLLRLGVCPEGTVGNVFTFDQLLANKGIKNAQEKTFCHITLAGYYGTQGDEGEHHALAKPCPAGQSAAQGAESCTSAAAATPAAADSAGAAMPTAAASAGAAMPIAAAVAAVAMPLLI